MMERKLVKTDDGSHTLHVPGLGEHYHSIHGAVTESTHIFIRAGLEHISLPAVRILEYGLGTGLNMMLTYCRAAERGIKVYYHAIEKYPVIKTEAEQLNLSVACGMEDNTIFNLIHESPWDEDIRISDTFIFHKEQADFRTSSPGSGYNLVYYDAFSPEVQPLLWTEEIFHTVYSACSPGAILTTYSAKGRVRRNFIAAGFEVEKLPGPPGKREFIRCRKPSDQ